MPAPASMPRVFISYSSKDTALVTRLREDLKREGVAVWLDHEQLTPGTPDWRAAVLRGIDQATTVIYCASPDAAASTFVGHELAIAEGEKKLILPFWIHGEKWYFCAPMGFYFAQYIDGRDAAYPAGLQALLATLGSAPATTSVPAPQPQRPAPQPAPRPAAPAIPAERFPARLATLGFTSQARDGVEWIIPPVCLVPAGQFRMGSDKAHDPNASDDELKRRTVDLPAFEIARFPVTVAEYACFLRATKRREPRSLLGGPTWERQLQRLDHPVVNVQGFDGFDYADWLAECTQQSWRLPTEAEWEKAARCDPHDPLGASSQRIYPWGDAFDKMRCSTRESGQRGTTPIGWYGLDDPGPRAGRQSGASPCGAEELAGTVWEWLATAWADDYSTSEAVERRESTDDRGLRGGSWNDPAKGTRAAYRILYSPDVVVDNIRFRLVRASPGG